MFHLPQRAAHGASIFAFISDHLNEDGRLNDPDLILPDEKAVDAGSIRFAGGALDGIRGGEIDTEAANRVATLIADTSRNPSKKNLRDLYAVLRDEDALAYVDPMLDDLTRQQPDPEAIHHLAVWLTTTSSDRGPVKIGLSLLGAIGIGDDAEIVRVLGTHDEFTLYSAVAIRNGSVTADADLWELAKRVDGWGRIQCVERLRDTDDPQIRDWILREGFRNSVMYEYLAYIAATTGDLHTALTASPADRDLLTAAGQILAALIDGGPAEDIGDYEDAPAAITAYLGHMLNEASSPADFHAVARIESYLEPGSTQPGEPNTWSSTAAASALDSARTILERDIWPNIIEQGLRSADHSTAWLANDAARRSGIDTYSIHLAKVVADPIAGPWYAAWQAARGDTARASELVSTAIDAFPARLIASGPSNALGLGPEHAAHRALDWTLQELPRFPGLGGQLLLTALRSPVTRNRNMAVRSLEKWPDSAWPAGAVVALQTIATSDPYPQLRATARVLLDL